MDKALVLVANHQSLSAGGNSRRIQGRIARRILGFYALKTLDDVFLYRGVSEGAHGFRERGLVDGLIVRARNMRFPNLFHVLDGFVIIAAGCAEVMAHQGRQNGVQPVVIEGGAEAARDFNDEVPETKVGEVEHLCGIALRGLGFLW